MELSLGFLATILEALDHHCVSPLMEGAGLNVTNDVVKHAEASASAKS